MNENLLVPVISDLPHAEQAIRASIWNYPNMWARDMRPKDPRVHVELSDETKALFKKMWDEVDTSVRKLFVPRFLDKRTPEEIHAEQLAVIASDPSAGRPRVLEHMMLLSGTGWFWNEDGQLINIYDEPVLRDPYGEPTEQDLRRWRQDFGVRDHDDLEEFLAMPETTRTKWDNEAQAKRLAEENAFYNQFETLATNMATKVAVSEVSEHSPVMTIPDNVTDDWIVVCEQAIAIILENAADNEERGVANLAKGKQAARNLARIKQARAAL